MSPAAGTKLMQDWADFWSAFSTRDKFWSSAKPWREPRELQNLENSEHA
jgi:hypothetical protein